MTAKRLVHLSALVGKKVEVRHQPFLVTLGDGNVARGVMLHLVPGREQVGLEVDAELFAKGMVPGPTRLIDQKATSDQLLDGRAAGIMAETVLQSRPVG